eukprot:gene24271-biopygen8929
MPRLALRIRHPPARSVPRLPLSTNWSAPAKPRSRVGPAAPPQAAESRVYAAAGAARRARRSSTAPRRVRLRHLAAAAAAAAAAVAVAVAVAAQVQVQYPRRTRTRPRTARRPRGMGRNERGRRPDAGSVVSLSSLRSVTVWGGVPRSLPLRSQAKPAPRPRHPSQVVLDSANGIIRTPQQTQTWVNQQMMTPRELYIFSSPCYGRLLPGEDRRDLERSFLAARASPLVPPLRSAKQRSPWRSVSSAAAPPPPRTRPGPCFFSSNKDHSYLSQPCAKTVACAMLRTLLNHRQPIPDFVAPARNVAAQLLL